LEYRFLEMALELLGNTLLVSKETCRFSGPQSLVNAKLIQPVDPAVLNPTSAHAAGASF
jgi:hypothetical protein